MKRIADEPETALHELTRCFSYHFGFRLIALIGALSANMRALESGQ
jgi:hypothetical protein